MSLSRHAPSLRAINYRLSSTPIKELPRSAPQVAASLWNIRDVLSASPETLKSNAEISTLVHRFKTTLSSLLQDRTSEGRWTAVVIAKAALEAGGLETLSKSGIWIKSLLTILKKSDPPTTKILVIITLTRIFSLTWDHSQLVREITTPALPTFTISCLNIVEHKRCSARELDTVLEAFATLVPRHSTIFRTYEAQIRKILSRILSSPSARGLLEISYTASNIEIAQRLLVLLHHCAARQGGAEKWEQGLASAVDAAHDTCNILFRSVVESRGRFHSTDSTNVNGNGFSGGAKEDPLGLVPWEGIYAGSERLSTLLGIIEAHIKIPTSNSVKAPIGLVFGLVSRTLTVTAPLSVGSHPMKLNAEVARDEREAMFTILPDVHVATLKLVDVVLARFGDTLVSTIHGLLELVAQLFTDEQSNPNVRVAVYHTVRTIVEIFGPSLSKENVADLDLIIKTCCDDLLNKDATTNALQSAAVSLLPALLSKIGQTHIPRQRRVQMERAAVLTNQREALVASVMNPARKDSQAALQPSLVPILARLHPASSESEALLRPRMPVLVTEAGGSRIDDVHSIGDSDENRMTSTSNGTQDGSLEVNELDVLSHPNEEHLYSSTPQPPAPVAATKEAAIVVHPLHAEPQQGLKRQATQLPESEVSPKRPKAPTNIEQISINADSALTLPLAVENAVPLIAVPIAEPTKLKQETAGPHDSSQSIRSVQPVHGLRIPNGGESDDSDFEIPEINPDPDTDPEDEDDAH